MKITINIKPTKIVARTKDELVDKICSMGANFVISNGFSGYCNRKSNHLYLYNAVKYRHKSTDTDKGRVRVRDAHWEAFVYKIPTNMVDRAKQHSRNFTLKIKCA